MDVGRIQENASIAREQIMRCRGITQHFLRMSRGQRSPGNIVALKETIDAVRRLIEPTARSHTVTIDVEPVAEGILVRADESELHQVLVNLILNAIQACQREGRVRVQVSVRDRVRLRVTDNGCGISRENLGRIFEPFFGLRQGGTGLGLFLTLNFVRNWGGDIHVESTPGAGATFEVVLPAFEPAGNQVNAQ